MEMGRGSVRRFLLVGLLLGFSVLVARVCDAHRKNPQRKSRQVLEDEGAGRKVPGVWSVWGSWSPCTQTCGVGIVERSRTCLAPAPEAPWDPSLEPVPHGVRTYSQPPFHKDTPNPFPYAAGQPFYPLHTDGNSEVPPFVPSVPIHRNPGAYRPPSADRYGPYPRHSRHHPLGAEEGLPFQKPEHRPSQRESVLHERETDFSQEAGQHPRPDDPSSRELFRQEGSSHHGSTLSHRTTNREPPPAFARRNVSRGDVLPLHRHSAKDSLPLFRPERQELLDSRHHSDSPRRSSSEDPGSHRGHKLSGSPTKEPRSARRSRVRDSIKPGKYGYGKVPFALSLHKEVEEAKRLRRHQHESPYSVSRKQKRKAPHTGLASSREDSHEVPSKEKPHQGTQLLNLSFSDHNEMKNGIRSPNEGLQRDSHPSHVKQEKDLPTDSPSQHRPRDGKKTSSEVPGQRQPLQRQVDWSVEEFPVYLVRKIDRTKRQSEKQENSYIASRVRPDSEDSSEEASQDLPMAEKSGEQLYPSEEPLNAPPAGESEILRTSEVHLSKVYSYSPGTAWSTKRPATSPYPSQAAKKERTPLPFSTDSWVVEDTPTKFWEEDTSEEHGEEGGGSKEAFRVSAEKASSRERTGISLHLQDEMMPNKTNMAQTSEIVESVQNRTTKGLRLEYQDGFIESRKIASASIELKPGDQVSPSKEGQEGHKKQSPSLDNQRQQTRSHGKQRATQRPEEHEPYSSRRGPKHQDSQRHLQKITPQTSGEVFSAGESHHRVPHLHQYSRPQAQTSTFHPTGQAVRPRSQRQNEYRHGGFAARPPYSLFREPPPIQSQMEADMWLPHDGNPALPHARGQGPSHSLPMTNELQQWNLYHPGTESFHCEGEQKQYQACSQEPCAAGSPDSRAMQCAMFDNQEFMGRLYQWEPFTEVQGYQRCELNCRPTGYRFYVRHTEKVQDGTPCEAASTDICVAGQCLRPGCDGILGSNKTLDDCGMCGGDGKACKLMVGIFNDSNVPIGYHKILEIPKGATKINVTEMTRSPNYLALRVRSGKSVINGNWAVDPPGTYAAGGTEFIYTRPGREESSGGESFVAHGPTTEALDVYMIFQQDNPGVSYQFFVSSLAHSSNTLPGQGPASQLPQQESSVLSRVSSSDQLQIPSIRTHPVGGRNVPVVAQGSQPRRSFGTLQRNVRVPPLPAPNVHNQAGPPEFYWRRVRTTECSVTCGKGFWSPVFQCASRSTHEEVDETECDVASKPAASPEVCSTQPCPAFWDMGEWSICSKSCGPGIQHRQVLCRQMYANRTTMVHPQRCSQLQKPNVTQACQLRVCSHWEIHTNWTSCSVLCGLGQRTRHVRCISNHGNVLSDGDCSTRMRPKTSEACDMGPCVRSWFHNDWSHMCSVECGTGIQRRSVVCLSSDASGESGESCVGSKPADMRACNSGPCQRAIRWYAGPWGQCSSECDDGTQRRDVICVSKLGSEFNMTDPSECVSQEKPSSLQPCNAGPCGARWFTTPWSTCSKSCLGGLQVREVRCLTENRTFSRLCDLGIKPMEKQTCNPQMCALQLDDNCKDKYYNCLLVVQARLCVYAYYKMACCASCARALDRTQTAPSR